MAKKDEGYGEAEGAQGDVGKAVARELQKKAQEGGGGGDSESARPSRTGGAASSAASSRMKSSRSAMRWRSCWSAACRWSRP